MTPSVSLSADVLAVTATICRLVPSVTVWREPDIIGSPLASTTVRATEPGRRAATHTVTDRFVTCRSTGPARTWGRVLRREASVVQAILASRMAIRTTHPVRVESHGSFRGCYRSNARRASAIWRTWDFR